MLSLSVERIYLKVVIGGNFVCFQLTVNLLYLTLVYDWHRKTKGRTLNVRDKEKKKTHVYIVMNSVNNRKSIYLVSS